MRSFNELNINERGKPVDRQAPTEEQIANFENALGIKLPSGYIEMLNHSNGGHPELDTFVPVGTDEANTWAVNRFYHLDSDKSSSSSLWSAVDKWKSVLGSKLVPFASDSGGNQILFSFIGDGIPSVKLCIHDQNFKVIDVAANFEEFIDLLSEDPDMI